jgi:hypothetical protein
MVEHEIIKFDVTEAAITKMSSIYMDLVVMDIYDEEGFQAVHDARMVVVKHRTGVEKHRKFLKADALAHGKKVDAAAKEIQNKLAPIETHLTEQEKIVTDEKKRVEEEEAQLFKDKIDDRVTELSKYMGSNRPPWSYQKIAVWSDGEFLTALSNDKAAWDSEQAKIAEEKRLEDERVKRVADEQEAERRRLADERKAQEEAAAKRKAEMDERDRVHAEKQKKIDDELAVVQAEIDAAKKEIQDEKDRLEKEAFEVNARKNAKIRAEADAKAAAEKAEAEEAALEIAEAAKAEQREALKPDLEKFRAWIEAWTQPPVPKIERAIILEILNDCIAGVREVLDEALGQVNELEG